MKLLKGSLAYLETIIQDTEDIISIEKDNTIPCSVNIIVKQDFNEKTVQDFINENLSYGIASNIISFKEE